jgi:5'-methylthioadenosine phosphorylase
MKQPAVLGVIGGSGLYEIQGLSNTSWRHVESPFGRPSDDLLFGELGELQLVFLPRHGRGHFLAPSEINYRANIDALKRVGVTDIVAISAVGSLTEQLSPGTFVIIDQFIDRTFLRQKSFFGSGCVAHVSMANPVCSRLGNHLEEAGKALKLSAVRGGTYLVMEGPQFSTLAESELYRSWGCDVVGMTNMPEAKLAREAEICYASIAMVTDYDCWHTSHENVTVEQIIKVLASNANNGRALIREVSSSIRDDANGSACPCKRSLDFALITSPESRDPDLLAKLNAVAGRVLSSPT